MGVICGSWGLPVVEIAGSKIPVCGRISTFLSVLSLAQIWAVNPNSSHFCWCQRQVTYFPVLQPEVSSVFYVVFHCSNLNMNWVSPSSLICHPAYNLFRVFCLLVLGVFLSCTRLHNGWCYNAVSVECNPFWIYNFLLFPRKRGCVCYFNYPEKHRNHSSFRLFPEKWLSFGYCEMLKFLS